MSPEIRELYVQLVKRGRTIDDLKKDNQQKFDFKSGYIDLCGFPVENKFQMSRAYAQVLAFLYPDREWK